MTASSSALLLASAYSDCFIGVECMDGIARVKAERLPLADTDCLIVWEADGTEWEEAEGGYKTVNIDIPLGRMKGDVDGDGYITLADRDLVVAYISNNNAITNEVDFWCGDVTNDGRISSTDRTYIQKTTEGTQNVLVLSSDKGINPDYYNNWSFYKVDDLSGYFYYDVPIEGMTANSTAILLVSNYEDCFTGVECLEGVARIKASRCPVGNCKGAILWKVFEQVKLKAVVSVSV